VIRHAEGADHARAGSLLRLASGDRVVERESIRVVVQPVGAIRFQVEATAGRPMKFGAYTVAEFGLSSGIITRSLAADSHFRRHSTAGMVMVNVPTAGVDYHVPFGGRRASSFGPREQGTHAREFFTVTKTAYVAPGRP